MTSNTAEDTGEGGGGESTFKVSFNILNTIIGSGIVALPYALHNAGFGFGLLMLCVIALLSQFALYALVSVGKRTGCMHYSSVTEAALGPLGYHLLNWSMVIDMVGTVILYLMLVGDLVTALIDIYAPFSASRTTVILAVSGVFILPQLFYRNTGPLARLSIVSVLCIPYIIVAVAVRAHNYVGEISFDYSFFGPRILPAMGVLAFTYSSCHAAFPNYMGLQHKTLKSWVRASSAATLGASVISAAFALTGYMAFGYMAKPNILENFDDNDHAINLGRLLFAVSLMLTTPMGFYPIRDTVTEMLQIDPARHNVGRGPESLCTVAIFSLCAVLAARFTDLGLAYELIGALSSSVVNFLLPALIYLWAGTNVSLVAMVCGNKDEDVDGEDTSLLTLTATGDAESIGSKRISTEDVAKWAAAWVVAAFGAWIMVLGTYNIFQT